jgi:hypothetical protein
MVRPANSMKDIIMLASITEIRKPAPRHPCALVLPNGVRNLTVAAVLGVSASTVANWAVGPVLASAAAPPAHSDLQARGPRDPHGREAPAAPRSRLPRPR